MNGPSGHNGYLGLEPWDGRVLRLSLDDIVGQAREQGREQSNPDPQGGGSAVRRHRRDQAQGKG